MLNQRRLHTKNTVETILQMGRWFLRSRGYNRRSCSCAGSQEADVLKNQGPAVSVTVPDFTESERELVESAYDHGAEMIVTPCPPCQANVEVYQSEINREQGTKFNMPVLYYSQLMTVAHGGSVKEAGLDGHLIQPTRLQEIASKK